VLIFRYLDLSLGKGVVQNAAVYIKGPGILCEEQDTSEFKDGESVLNINDYVCLLDITIKRSELETLCVIDFTER
jgi:hypothetical protein